MLRWGNPDGDYAWVPFGGSVAKTATFDGDITIASLQPTWHRILSHLAPRRTG